MWRRWLTLGTAAGMLLTLGACGRHQGGGQAAGDPPASYRQQNDPRADDTRQEAHTVRVASAKVEKGAERATRGIVESVAAIAQGVGRGVREGAEEGVHNADPHAYDRHRRHGRNHDQDSDRASNGD